MHLRGMITSCTQHDVMSSYDAVSKHNIVFIIKNTSYFFFYISFFSFVCLSVNIDIKIHNNVIILY